MPRTESIRNVVAAITCFGLAACSGTNGKGGENAGGVTPLGADSGASSGGSPGATPSADAVGCDGAKRLAVPVSPGARGPWAVGAKTVTIAGLTTEIWYPAQLGSEAGKTKVSYDIREHLPTTEQKKIPDAENPLQACDCYRDLPIDAAHGAYPVVQFIHGTAAFRTQSLTLTTHWASRGFIVVSTDHPGIRLKDLLGSVGGGGGGGGARTDQAGDAMKVLDALKAPSGELAFLAGHIDVTRIGMSGHSAGGGAIAGFGARDGVRLLMPLASRGVRAGSSLVSTLVMGGQVDGIAAYTGQQGGYASSPKKKRLVGVANAGHLAFSDLCFIGRDKGGILKIAEDNKVAGAALLSSLAQDGCKPGQLAAEDGWAVVNYATTGVLEETLACSATAGAELAKLKTLPNVGEYQEEL